jgi:aspartate racemase
LPLLTETEQHQLLVEWNNSKRHYPKDRCIHQLIEEQAARTPTATAVAFGEQRLSYKELDKRATQLARHLRALGVGREVLVGIYMERSLDLVVGLLGVLKAGAAYMPLEPNYPMERLKMVLEDSQTPVVLTQQRLVQSLPECAARILCLDSDWEIISQQSDEQLLSPVAPDNLAYVIYTSGSTGPPKGVQITHGALVNFASSASETFELGRSDRVLQFASISFDTAAEEIFPCLIRGATLVLRTDSMLDSISLFLRKCRDWGITVLDLPTAYWQELTEQLCSKQLLLPEQLRLVVIGGERAIPGRLAQWQKCSDTHVRLLNTYGPTEATVVATTWKLVGSAEDVTSMREVPIGHPIANVQTHVLDRYLNPVPIGVFGELHIGGAGLGRGYLNGPELTAEKFIPNPFSNEPGARLYKTGDLARYRPDGNIEFLGRVDSQAKIRGFRIELGEVEAALNQHRSVRETAVVVREDELGNNKLVAYIVTDRGQAPTVSELRSFLKLKLPEYMVPSAFMFLDALPVTVNGKIDRRALPVPDHSMPELEGAFVAPRTSTEEILVRIWAKLLGLKQIGIRDNFFDLGGHSLLAVRLFAEIEKEFNKYIPLSTLFQSATIEHLASVISQKSSSTASSLVAIQPNGTKRPFFCVHEFFGDVLCYMNLARHMGQDQPFYALQAKGLDGVEEPFDDIKAMAAHYIEAIRTVQPRGPYALGGLCIGGLVAFEMAQQLREKGEDVAVVALLDSLAVNSGYRKNTLAWKFLHFIKDLPSWLMGSTQLNRLQWIDLIQLKIRMAKISFSSGGARHQFIKEMGDLFHFSEQHRKIARAQQRALREYTPQLYPGCLTLFRARMQPLLSSHHPDKGWSRLAGGGLKIKVVPGNHLAMLQEPHVKILAKELRACLERSVSSTVEARCARNDELGQMVLT